MEEIRETYYWCRTYRKGSRLRAVIEALTFEIRSRFFGYAELEENKEVPVKDEKVEK